VQDARQHAALAAALLIGVQLVLGYWFYNYLIWFYPLLLVALIQPARQHRDAETLADSTRTIDVPGEVQMPLVAAAAWTTSRHNTSRTNLTSSNSAGVGRTHARADGEPARDTEPCPLLRWRPPRPSGLPTA
jgi:hypothetical protein